MTVIPFWAYIFDLKQDTKQFFINPNETIMLKYDSFRPTIKHDHPLDNQIVAKKFTFSFIQYKNE